MTKTVLADLPEHYMVWNIALRPQCLGYDSVIWRQKVHVNKNAPGIN